jgi:glycosyltransferase involved in cell wall biosynthesis
MQESLLAASIVVPCFNAEKTIVRCLEACLSQDYPDLEIIFVDDGSSDSTLPTLRTYDGITVLAQDNQGPAAARNLGWRSSSGEIICFTDSDCLPNPRWVSRLVEHYIDSPVGAVGGSYDIVNPESWLARCIHEEIRQRHLAMPKQVGYLGSFNVSYARTALEQTGGFDDGFRRASAEDNDLSYRVAKLGYTLLFDVDNCVAHHHTENFWRYMRQQFCHGYCRIMLYIKQPDKIRGDEYIGFFELLQLPLSLLAALAWLFSWASYAVLFLALVLTALVIGGQIPMTWSIVQRTGDMRYAPYASVMSARAFSRGLGMGRAFLGRSPAEMVVLIKALFRAFLGGRG